MSKYYLCISFCFIWLLSSSLYGKERAHIALVYDGLVEQWDAFSLQVEAELIDLLDAEFELRFFPVQDQWHQKGVARKVTETLNDPKIDLVIAMGILSSYEMLKQTNLSKPVVIGYNLSIFSTPKMFFPAQQSSKIAFYQSPLTLTEEISTFTAITQTKKLGFIGDTSLIGDPNFLLIQRKIEQKMASLGVIPIFIPIQDHVAPALSLLDDTKVDGVVFLPTWRLKKQDFQELVDGVNGRELPSFSIKGEDEVEAGVLMTLTQLSQNLT